MKIKKLTEQKGIGASDALIAVIIIALFAGLIATISYNIYLSSTSVKRMSQATNYIVDVFEYIDKTYYDDITKEKLIKYFNDKYYYENDGKTVKDKPQVKMIDEGEDTDTPYKSEIAISKYKDQEGNSDKLDLVQEVKMTVSYKLGNKEQKLEMKKIKTRENLTTPNAPDLSKLSVQDGHRIYPIKKVDNVWKISNLDDDSWYNYESGNWALVLETTRELDVGKQIDTKNLSNDEKIYAWIPRYAYNSSNNSLEFLFSDSNNYVDTVDGYTKITPIDSSYTVLSDFSKDNNSLTGVWTTNNTQNAYSNLNKVYPLNN